jgi:hypothetical protein
VSAWGSVGRTTLVHTHPPATGSRFPMANVGHSWIILPENVTCRGSLKTRIRMAV